MRWSDSTGRLRGAALAVLLVVELLGVPASAARPSPGPAPASTPPGVAPSASPFSLSIALNGGQLSWRPGRSIAATVAVGASKATGLLANVALTDETTLAQLGDGDFQICDDPLTKCKPVVELGPNTVRRVYLRPRVERLLPGKYAGSVQLIADEGKSDSVQVTATYTSAGYIWTGVALVAFGVIVSFLSTGVIRNRLVRLQMLEAAKMVRDRLGTIETSLGARKPKVDGTPHTTATIRLVREALTAKRLDAENLLPRFFSPDAAALAGSAAFKDKIDRATGWATVMAHIVNLGFLPLAALDQRKPSSSQDADAAIRLAWGQLDELAVHVSDVLEAAPDLAATDANIQAAVASVARYVPALGGSALSRNDDEWIGVQFALFSFANWAIASILTIAVGSYVMVFSHPDFGRPTDLWMCAFWGFGLPTVAQLGQATPSSIAASMGITLPK